MKLLLANPNRTVIDALRSLPEYELAVVPGPLSGPPLAPPDVVHWREISARYKLDMAGIWELRKLILEFRPEIIHAFHGTHLAMCNLALMGVRPKPAVVSFRGIIRRMTWLDPGEALSFLHPRVAAHGCASEAVRQTLLQAGIAEDRCVTTYDAIDPTQWKCPGRAALEAWNIPADALIVGTVATIRPIKGIDLLLKAALRMTDCNVHYVLIGRVWDEQVQALAANPQLKGRVHLLGPRTDAKELISGADVFVMPSRKEGLCVALLEAMAQGVCPLVSAAGGMPEVVRHEQDGLVFPVEDVPALATALRRLEQNRALASTYASSAQKRARSEFTPQKLIERTQALYRRVA